MTGNFNTLFQKIGLSITDAYEQYINEIDSVRFGEPLPTKPDYLNIIESINSDLYEDLLDLGVDSGRPKKLKAEEKEKEELEDEDIYNGRKDEARGRAYNDTIKKHICQ